MKRALFVLAAVIGGLACGVGADPADDTKPIRTTPPTTKPRTPSTTPPTTEAAAGDPLVTEYGAGPARVGSVSSGAMEGDYGFLFDLRPVTDQCSYAYDQDDGIGVITNADTLVLAMIIGDPDKRTYGDIGVGSTVDEVLRQFGANAEVLDVITEDGGPLVQIAPAGGPSRTARGIYFRTDSNQVVTQYRVGMWPWVEYEQYCEPSPAQ